MLDSLRARLLVWYALILALVIVGFAAAVCYLYWRSGITELDRRLAGEAQAIARALHAVSSGEFDLDLSAGSGADQEEATVRQYHAVWNRAGELVDRSGPEVAVLSPGAPVTRTRAGQREVAVQAASDALVLVGRPMGDLHRDVVSLGTTVAVAGLLALAVALLGGWFLVGRALAPIARISGTARRMAEGELAARIAVDRTENELGQLASVLNDAFDRLRLAVGAQRRFTADASHELRTPLATMSAEVEWALGRDRPASEYRNALEICRRATTRMQAVVERLLTLAQADSAELVLRKQPVWLASVVRDALELLGPLAERKRLALATRFDGVLVRGDPERLREMIVNLLSNAIQYSHEGGRIDVEVRRERNQASIRVADSGIGIEPGDLPRVFDRFYRADGARARRSGGAGLGLAIARSIAEGHGGTILCRSTPGEHTEFIVSLAAEPADEAPWSAR